MATVKQIISIMRDFAPESKAMLHEYDNVGLLVGDEQEKVQKVLVCLDVTANVIEEAIKSKSSLIISHHPFIYSPIKSITSNDAKGRQIIKAIQNGINIYSAHTNLDCVSGGINEYVAQKLGLKNLEVMDKYISNSEGLGRFGMLDKAVSFKEFIATAQKVFSDEYIMTIGNENRNISKVCVINGSGGDIKYIDKAKEMGADVFVTAEIKHHIALYANEIGMAVIEPQHYNMEHLYISHLTNILKNDKVIKTLGVEILQSKNEVNPKNRRAI